MRKSYDFSKARKVRIPRSKAATFVCGCRVWIEGGVRYDSMCPRHVRALATSICNEMGLQKSARRAA